MASTVIREAGTPISHDNRRTCAFGAATSLIDRVSDYSVLVRFAIFQSEGGPVPNGATIQSATLSLYKFTANDYTYRAHRLLQDWTEAEATWNRRRAGLPWAVPGAAGVGSDYAASSDGQAAIGSAPGWLQLDVTPGVQAMSGGQQNHGWKLVPVSGNNNLKRFHSSEATADPTLRPRLTITYSGGGPPSNQSPTVTLTAPANNTSVPAAPPAHRRRQRPGRLGCPRRVLRRRRLPRPGRDGPIISFTWTSPSVGTHTLTAIAVDNTIPPSPRFQARFSITVSGAGSGEQTVMLQRLSGYQAPATRTLTAITPHSTLALKPSSRGGRGLLHPPGFAIFHPKVSRPRTCHYPVGHSQPL